MSQILKAIKSISIRELILLWLAIHLLLITQPNAAVFDEAYYTKAARDLIQGVASNIEHPFLGKAWGAIGILIFGDNAFGWRIVIVVFGALLLYTFYQLACRYVSERMALLATAYLGFDHMFFVHSSLFLLEIPALFFAVVSFSYYLKRRIVLSAVFMGISILSKETSLFLLFTMILIHLANMKMPSKQDVLKALKFTLVLLATVAIPMQIYISAYRPSASEKIVQVVSPVVVVAPDGSVLSTTTTTTWSSQKEYITNVFEHWRYIVSYASSLTTKGSNIGPENFPWNWFIPTQQRETIYYRSEVVKNITYYSDGVYVGSRLEKLYPINWRGVSNLPLWYSIWVVVPLSIYLAVKRRLDEGLVLSFLWIVGTYVPLLAMSLALNRIQYPFYFINTLPALALGLPIIFSKLNVDKVVRDCVLAIFLGWTIASFLIYFPLNIWALS
ncbi:MAG: glycosyltransferase family 39 protein [Nitrososphaerales archaeon]